MNYRRGNVTKSDFLLEHTPFSSPRHTKVFNRLVHVQFGLSFLLVGLVVFVILVSLNDFAYGEQDNTVRFIQKTDITQIAGEKYQIQVDDQTFVIYHGFADSFEIEIEEIGRELPVVSSMMINAERKSLEINFENSHATEFFWTRIPTDLLAAERSQYQVFIDGKGSKYDLVKYPNDTRIGFILPKGSQHVEIVGTYVVPEFGYLASVVFTLSIIIPIILVSKSKVHVG